MRADRDSNEVLWQNQLGGGSHTILGFQCDFEFRRIVFPGAGSGEADKWYEPKKATDNIKNAQATQLPRRSSILGVVSRFLNFE